MASPNFSENLEKLQLLREQQDKAMIARTFCRGNLRIVRVVHNYFERIKPISISAAQLDHRLQKLIRRVEGYEDGFRLLQARIANSIELVSGIVPFGITMSTCIAAYVLTRWMILHSSTTRSISRIKTRHRG